MDLYRLSFKTEDAAVHFECMSFYVLSICIACFLSFFLLAIPIVTSRKSAKKCNTRFTKGETDRKEKKFGLAEGFHY